MRRSFVLAAVLGALLGSPLLGVPRSAQAQAGAMFAGYEQLCGLPVFVMPNPQSASATIHMGQRVIILDPSVMGDWSMSRKFAIAHECAHHMLGHVTPEGMWFRHTQQWATRRQELDADCWAAKQLAARGQLHDLRRMIEDFRRATGTSPGYPSGPERAQNVAQCAGLVPGGAAAPSSSHGAATCRQALVPCVHPMHPQGDLVPCQHPCMTPYGPMPCHPAGDLVPCRHPQHPQGDLICR